MELKYAFLASYGEFTADGKLNLIGGDFDALHLDQLPITFPVLHLLAKIILTDEEAAQSTDFRAGIFDPHDAQVGLGVEGFLGGNPSPGSEASVAFALAVGFQQVQFSVQGIHRVRLAIGGRTFIELPLSVQLRPGSAS
jgi:hypothetical protein